MKPILLRFSTTLLLAAALTTVPLLLTAQTTNNKTAASKTVETEKPAKGGPFHGKLAAIDKVAKTITVGKRSFQITSETKLRKAGKPATFEDAVVGETVSGYVKPAADGKLVATTVNFGAKTTATSDSAEKPKSTGTKEPK
jgi:hypothetical protein